MTGLFEQQRAAMSGRFGGGAGNVFDPNVVVDIGRRIEREFARFEALSGGVLGISAVNLSDGRMLGYRTDDAFPMASTFKVSLAMLVLQQAEVGLLDMAQMVALEADLRVPPPLIEAYFRHPGLTVSVANLLDIMLVTSDNSATDALLHLVGGPVAVMRAIEKAGIAGMRVDRSTSSFLANFLDLEVPAGQSFATVFASLPLSKKGRLYALTEQANNGYEDDPRDSTTPAAMARLLQKLWQGDLLGTTGQSTLFEIMERCENDERLKGLLPHGTKVAHKTGTLGGATSDVGIVELPYGAGTMAIAVYVKKSRAPTPQRERAIAHATRTVYDYMIFGQAEISNGSR